MINHAFCYFINISYFVKKFILINFTYFFGEIVIARGGLGQY